jgi:NAD(P)H dehydrogenase (quinone)
MLALIIVANPGTASFSHAMADVARQVLADHDYDIAFHDLYAEQFDPVQPTGEMANTSSADSAIEQHCAELARADLILIFHPNWWGQPPAILKGWVDRVFRLNTAYAYPPGVGPEGVPVGLLRARHALVFNTSNTPPEREAALFGDPLDTLWKRCIFGLCGLSHPGSVVRRMFSPVAGSTAEQRAGWVEEVRLLVEQCAAPDDAAIDAPWLPIALAEIGIAQFPAGQSNPRITQYHEGTNIRGYDDKASWCSSFVDWCFRQVGVAGTGSALARSWLEWGTPLAAPVSGCVVVLSREDPSSWKGHVGFYLRSDDEFVYLLGGNQLEAVREHFYPLASVLGYRWPVSDK